MQSSSNIRQRCQHVAALRNSVLDGDETDDTSVDPSADASPNNSEDPDGTPLFDTYERATSDKDHATAVRGFTQEFAKRIGVLEG